MRAPSNSNEAQRGHAERESPAEQMTVPSIMRSRLFRKYVGLLIAVVPLVLVANSAVEIWFRYQDQRDSLLAIQRGQAETAAGQIAQFIREIESEIGWTTQLPWSSATLEERRFDALRLLRWADCRRLAVYVWKAPSTPTASDDGRTALAFLLNGTGSPSRQ